MYVCIGISVSGNSCLSWADRLSDINLIYFLGYLSKYAHKCCILVCVVLVFFVTKDGVTKCKVERE